MFTLYSHLYFQPNVFNAIVSVNLSSLLILTTLFIGISNSLPRIVFNGQSLTQFVMTFQFAIMIGQNVIIANRVETNFQMSSNFRNHLALTKHHRKTPNVIANQFLKFTNYSHAQMSSQTQTSSQTESNFDH